MKKLALIVLLAVGMTAFAQEEKRQDNPRIQKERLSPEQRNQLYLKKLTLDLNLNESQQKDMGKLIAEQSAKREAAMAERKANRDKGVKPTADEIFKQKSQRLDDEATNKAKIQKILTAEQFKKWEDMKATNREHMKERMEKRADKRDDKKSE